MRGHPVDYYSKNNCKSWFSKNFFVHFLAYEKKLCFKNHSQPKIALSPWLVKRSSGQKLHSFHSQTISYHSNYRIPSRRKKIPPSMLLWDTRDDSYDIRKSPRSWIYYYCYGSSKELGNCEIHTPAWIMPRHISLGNFHFIWTEL